MSNEHLISKNIIQEYDDYSGDLLIGIEYFMHLKILFSNIYDLYIYKYKIIVTCYIEIIGSLSPFKVKSIK